MVPTLGERVPRGVPLAGDGAEKKIQIEANGELQWRLKRKVVTVQSWNNNNPIISVKYRYMTVFVSLCLELQQVVVHRDYL